MQYLQNRSFIASLTSTTPGYEGIIDSVEYSTHEGTQRKNEWLTVAAPSTVEFQQRFWFGYYDGAKPGYQIRTIEFGPGQAHYQTWDLSYGNNVGFYKDVKSPILWRVWTNGEKLGIPVCQAYEGVNIAPISRSSIGVRDRSARENRYVEVGVANKLFMTLCVEHVDVPLFDGYFKLDDIQRRRR